MVILQKPNHFLRWYGLVVGLVAFSGTLWVMQTVFGSAGAGVVLGGVLFFAVWAVLEVILVPFAVLLGVDTDRGMIQVGSEEFPFAYILSVQPCARPFGVDGGGQDPGDRLFVHSSYTRQWKLTGAPALAAPCGFSSDGLPLSFQLVGRPFEEATLLKVAAAYQGLTDWHLKTPEIYN